MCVWGLWSNFIKVCFSSVLSLLGIMYYFPAGNCNNVFEVRFQYEMRNLLQKCPKWYLSSCWNLGKIPFMSCSWCVSPGQLWSSCSYDCSSRRTAFLAAVTYWAVQWENIFNCWYLPRRIWVPGAVHQLPESVFVVPAAQQEMALWAFEAARRGWKESSYWLSSVIQLLKTCFIMRTRNSSVIPFCNRWVWSDTRGWLLEPGD